MCVFDPDPSSFLATFASWPPDSFYLSPTAILFRASNKPNSFPLEIPGICCFFWWEVLHSFLLFFCSLFLILGFQLIHIPLEFFWPFTMTIYIYYDLSLIVFLVLIINNIFLVCFLKNSFVLIRTCWGLWSLDSGQYPSEERAHWYVFVD